MISPPPDEAIRTFPRISAIDTCSVSNLLSSRLLFGSATARGLHFLLVEYVFYECLVKRRTKPNPYDDQMMVKLRDEIAAGKHFSRISLTVDDLQAIARLQAIKQLGRGELACIALASKVRAGFMTDDGGARRLARSAFSDMQVRTTAHLAGWLVYGGHLSDTDILKVIADNSEFRGNGHIGGYLRACYEHAQMLRLKDRT